MSSDPPTISLAQYVHPVALEACQPPPLNLAKSIEFNTFRLVLPLAGKLQS
jgi:hypothetical protein